MELLKCQGVRRMDLQKGEVLFRQGEVIDQVYYLTSGCINRSFISEKGDQIIYSSFLQESLAESLVGVLVMYSDNNTTTTDFVAITPCTGYIIPKASFLAYAEAHPDLLVDIIRYAVVEYRQLMEKFQVRHERKVANKVCSILYSSMRTNRTGELVVLGVRNIDISGSLGVHAVTVSRIMHALKEEDVISKYAGGWLIRNPEKLRTYAEGKPLEYR